MSENVQKLLEALELAMINAVNSGKFESLEDISRVYQRIKSVNQ